MKYAKLVTMLGIILCTCALYLLMQSTSVNHALKLAAYTDIIKLEISVLNPPYNSPTYGVKEPYDIYRIMRILDEAILIPAFGNNRSWRTRPFESYEILIYTSDDWYSYVRIYGNKYIGIEGRVYRIIRKSDVSKIYGIITAGGN